MTVMLETRGKGSSIHETCCFQVPRPTTTARHGMRMQRVRRTPPSV